ncbi:MAG: class I SAM-dependent methyltransferase [Deltaproteobacteria bacterium]|nr:class I SAM-dependent methyltransferase [Deltaproteobacteria bacterium]
MRDVSAFGLIADRYDAWYDSDQGRPVYESELKCLEALVVERRFPLLEVGVGTGRFAMRFPGAFGVDPALDALKLARNRGIRCVNGVGEALPFRDDAFMTVLIIATICFVKEPPAIFHEAARVLAPGGSVVIGFIPGESPWGLFYEKRKRDGSPFYSGARFYSLTDIEGFASEAGLRATSVMCTLLQDPAGPTRVEEPSPLYREGAGFVFLKFEKKKESGGQDRLEKIISDG